MKLSATIEMRENDNSDDYCMMGISSILLCLIMVTLNIELERSGTVSSCL